MIYKGLSRKYTVFLSTFQNVLFYYQDRKLTLKKTLKHDVNKNEDIKQLHSGNHTNSTNSVRNLSYFYYHMNIISKLMTEFVIELVETVHFFSIVTNFIVQAMRS